MIKTKAAQLIPILLILSLLPSWLAAHENFVDVGEYTIHYNAFTSDVLSPQIARRYGIVRSKSRGILNITVLKKVMGTPSQPVSAWVRATATNLEGQLRMLSMREIRARNAIHYIAQFSVAHEETLQFRVSVQPLGQRKSFTLEFSEKFYTL
jgi:hypothetical protein